MSYLTSIVVFSIISFAMITVFQDQIINNGWLSQEDIYETMRKGKAYNIIKFVSINAIPLFRVIVLVGITLMAFTDRETWI